MTNDTILPCTMGGSHQPIITAIQSPAPTFVSSVPAVAPRRMALWFATALLLPAIGPAVAGPTPMPIEKHGACPAGYYASGAYCVPGAQARFAILKDGACPTGYYSSGNYCVATAQGRLSIPKLGACPPGYFTSGAYCVQHQRTASPATR